MAREAKSAHLIEKGPAHSLLAKHLEQPLKGAAEHPERSSEQSPLPNGGSQ